MTLEEGQRLVAAAKGGKYITRHPKDIAADYLISTYYNAVMLPLNTGLRLGEVFGLRWSDIDFKSATISIRQQLTYSPSDGMIFQQPKSKKSRRELEVNELVVKALKKHAAQQKMHKNSLGDRYISISKDKHGKSFDDLVFTDIWGALVNTHSFVRNAFRNMLQEAGLGKDYLFHDLRHTFVSNLITENKLPIENISAILGHEDVKTTQNIYNHLMKKSKKQAAEITR